MRAKELGAIQRALENGHDEEQDVLQVRRRRL
jgi:hypothetical protein